MASSPSTATEHTSRRPAIFRIEWPLKPYLHDFLTTLGGGDEFVVVPGSRDHLIADINRICVAKPQSMRVHASDYGLDVVKQAMTKQQREYDEFAKGRKPYIVLVTDRFRESYGTEPRWFTMFERMVQHTFYQTLLAFCDANQAQDRMLTDTIRVFMDDYNVHHASVDYDTLRRTIHNMRAATGRHKNSTATVPAMRRVTK